MVDFAFIGRTAETDELRLVNSPELLDPADNVYHLVRVPWHALITNIYLHLISPFGSTSVITVGFDGNKEVADEDAFLLDANIVPDGAILTRSLKDSTAVNGGGKWFNANSGAITVSVTKGDALVTAALRLFVEYKVIHSAV